MTSSFTREEIDWLTALFDPLNESWTTRWLAPHEPRPFLLYHYTNATGLKGIVDSQRLWASNALYLNDATELVHARDVFQDVLESLRETYKEEPLLTFLDRARSLLDPPSGLYGVYVTCFCENGDLLSQWRGYPAEGGGYAIGLRTNLIEPISPDHLLLRRVIYDRDEQRRFLTAALEPVCAALLQLAGDEGKEVAMKFVPECLGRLRWMLAECAFCFKHPAFKEESEWRVVFIQDEADIFVGRTRLPVEFRSTATGFVPYVVLQLPDMTGRLPIMEVITGPTMHPELARDAVSMLFRETGHSSVEVKPSSVPLRA